MINGYVINNLGRGKHIFKQSVSPGAKVSLENLYVMYKKSYGGRFDLDFLEWLENKKIPKGCGFDIIVKEINKTEEEVVEDNVDNEDTVKVGNNIVPSKLSAKQISELKIKDGPKKIISEVTSKHKLRRALTLCKKMAGKETLVKYIYDRINVLK